MKRAVDAEQAWRDALAALRADMAAASRGEVDPQPWVPPSLPPLPAALRAEAAGLLEEIHLLRQELEVRRDLLEAERRDHGRPRVAVAAPATAQLVDHRL